MKEEELFYQHESKILFLLNNHFTNSFSLYTFRIYFFYCSDIKYFFYIRKAFLQKKSYPRTVWGKASFFKIHS